MAVLRLAPHTLLLLYPGLATPIDSVVGLVYSDGRGIVIDAGSGTPASIAGLAQSLAEAEAIAGSRLDIEIVVNTHGHAPNAGGDYWFHEALRALIAARPPDAKWIESGDPVKTAASDYGLVFHATIVGLHIREDPFQVYSGGGVIVEAIHTPGHTPGSQTIIVEDSGRRVVFAGDSLGRLSERWESSEEDWLASLEKIKETRPDILCTSAACYEGSSAREFIARVEEEGPVWIDKR